MIFSVALALLKVSCFFLRVDWTLVPKQIVIFCTKYMDERKFSISRDP